MAREEVAEARDTISARAATEPRLADELDHEAFVATEDADEDLLRDRYDWRGAVFGLEREDHGVEDGWSDIEAASLPDDGSGDGPMTEATVPVADVAAASAQPEAASRTAVALLEAASRATTRAAPPRQEALFADTAVATADAARTGVR